MPEAEAAKRQIISCVVLNRPGVLSRVAGLFAGRGFNIDSLAVGRTEDEKVSRMTIVSYGSEQVHEQIRKQLSKLIDVVKVIEFEDADFVERDLTLLKVHAPPSKRPEIMQVVEVFRGKIVDVGPRELTVELSGPEAKIDSFIELMRPYGLKEVARTGRIAMSRAPKQKKPAPGARM